MNRLKYLEDVKVWRCAEIWSERSDAIATLHKAGRVVSRTHRVALLVALKQLEVSQPRGKGYCLALSQLGTMRDYVSAHCSN